MVKQKNNIRRYIRNNIRTRSIWCWRVNWTIKRFKFFLA